MPPKRKSSAGSVPSATVWSKKLWAAVKNRSNVLEEAIAVVGSSPSFSAAELRKAQRLLKADPNLGVTGYGEIAALGIAIADAQRVSKWVAEAARGAPRAPSMDVEQALQRLVNRNVSLQTMGSLFGAAGPNLGGGELYDTINSITGGNVPALQPAAIDDIAAGAAISELMAGNRGRILRAVLKRAVEETGATKMLGKLMRDIASAKSDADNTAPIARSLRQAARGEVNGVPNCPPGYIPDIRNAAGNPIGNMDKPFINHRDGSKSLRPGYEVVGCVPARKLKGDFGAATISALVGGDEGLGASLAQIAPGQAFRARKKPRKAAASKAKKPKGKGYRKTSQKMPVRVTVKVKGSSKTHRRWTHRRIYTLTRTKPCSGGTRKVRAKGALFYIVTKKVPASQRKRGGPKTRRVQVFVTATQIKRAKDALRRSKAKKPAAKSKKTKKRKSASKSKARALLTDASAFDAKKKRKSKSKSKSGSKSKSTKASRSRAAKKAWATRRRRHGKTGLSKKYRAKK